MYSPTQPLMNVNNLSLAEKKSHIQEIYTSTSYFQTLFNQDHLEIDFLHYSGMFRAELFRLLLEKKIIPSTIDHLEQLHETLSGEMKAYNFDDGVNKISTQFYDTDQQFIAVYYQFIKFLRQNLLHEPFWFQATPTIRIHCPNAENNHHYPRYHSDISYGHPPEEINIWFPLTKLLTGHGFRFIPVNHSQKIIESFNYDFASFIHSAIYDKKFSAHCQRFSQPVTTEYGKLLAFDSRCIHTGEPLTAHTRVSIDIRILPLARYERMRIQYQGQGRRKVIFAPGFCYHELHSDELL
ncbi:MAG: hypothetical protein A3F11_07345 [Gammaproteobacteria bacterium RIFCSPHIGHO2_12_FULL_37_14]|nr:MAG: hypothetical protein A3F11_07345 [Gammaproteobacteria bacterium RIFCSPHIGHO2_12_FULL_37_14]